MVAVAAYSLCMITSAVCAFLLLRGYSRSRLRLLLWSGVCFLILSFANALIFVDLLLMPGVNLYLYRLMAGLAAMLILLYGLIWESN